MQGIPHNLDTNVSESYFLLGLPAGKGAIAASNGVLRGLQVQTRTTELGFNLEIYSLQHQGLG